MNVNVNVKQGKYIIVYYKTSYNSKTSRLSRVGLQVQHSAILADWCVLVLYRFGQQPPLSDALPGSSPDDPYVLSMPCCSPCVN